MVKVVGELPEERRWKIDEDRLEQLFDIADKYRRVGVKILHRGGGFSSYLLDQDGAPDAIVVLYGYNEYSIFLLFREPEIYSPLVKKWFREKLLNDEEFRKDYYTDIFEVRKVMRSKFKDDLMQEARLIAGIVKEEPDNKASAELAEPAVKPVYRSRTIWVNIAAAIIVAVLHQLGIDVQPEEVAAFLAAINAFMRAITKEPVR